MKKYLSLLLALVMVLSMMSFAHAEAGTFTGVGDGKNGAGSIEVEVDVDADGKLTDVRVTKNGDDAGISDPAVNTIPGLIVDLQSANIDVKTGATLTQGGIQMAVLDAVKKAGLDEAAFSELKAPEAQKSEDVDATYDVVVVGGGGAGLTASIRAAQAGGVRLPHRKPGDRRPRAGLRGLRAHGRGLLPCQPGALRRRNSRPARGVRVDGRSGQLVGGLPAARGLPGDGGICPQP